MTLLDIVTKGSTDRSVTLRIIDASDGTPETGVVYNTSGIDLSYRREGGAIVSITEAELATPSVDDAHADGGFIHLGNGEYRLDLPDAAFATGANYVDVFGTVTGMIVIGGRVRLTDLDLEESQANSISAGLVAHDALKGWIFGTIGATGNSTTALHMDELTGYGDDDLNGRMVVVFDDSGGINAVRRITDFVNSTDLATLDRTLPFTPENDTDTFAILPADVDGLTSVLPTAAQIRSEIDDNSTKLTAIKAVTDNLNDPSAAAIVTELLGTAIEGAETFVETLRILRAEAAGKVAVNGTEVTFRDLADSKDRITATVDSNGQRTAVSTDGE